MPDILGCLGEFGSCRLARSLLPLRFGIAAISARAAFVARQIAFVNLDLPGVADFDEGGAAVFHRRFDMLPRLQPLALLQNRHVPAPVCEFVAQPGDGGVLQHPERIAVSKATDSPKRSAMISPL